MVIDKNRFSNFKSDNARINIKMGNFHFFHRPVTGDDGEEMDKKYIEKSSPLHQVYNWIKYNEADSGSYLVTGYRGAGKSSFVGSLIRKLKEKSEIDYIPLFINFGQENIEEIEILRIIVKRLHGELLKRYARKYLYYSIRHNLLFFSLLLLAFSLTYAYKCPLGFYWIPVAIFLVLYIVLSFWKISPTVRAIRKLKGLMDRLHASVQMEMSQSAGYTFGDILNSLNFQRKKTRNMEPARPQEIEYDLIEVLDILKKDNKNRKVIIIFDELDKTDSTKRPEQTDGIPEFEKLSIRPEQKISSRTRKQEVLRMIANMKFFLSSAKAYFIFIAGREMYEAFQADMSDRDFSISSIFSGVINIDSFLTSSRNTNNSNQMTEQFVCKQLFPENIETFIKNTMDNRYDKKNIYCLKNYHRYKLKEGKDFYEDELKEGKELDLNCREQRLWREVLFLYHFVNYLTYISNGSPKKMTLFFEKNVRQRTYLEGEDKIRPVYECTDSGLAEDKDMEAFYLSFGYYSQEKINFIHYLTYPIMQNIINRSNLYGDKLLVSSSFLISHIFKLHNSGFSWRNLEQTPELLEINKTPEIREYIGSIIDFMNHTHLTTLACGLFHYKFPMKISEEISFHSKISGEVSAMFNFSRDEMQNIKDHYNRVLKYNENEKNVTEYMQASMHHSLGDIYMLEENYSDAIREYEKCIEGVAPMMEELKKEKEKKTNVQLLNYVSFMNRTMLKLGLAHEKRRTDNSAFILYEELKNMLNDFKDKGAVLFKNMRTLHLALLAQLYVLEKIDTSGIQYSHLKDACDLFDEIFKVDKNILVAADFYRKLGDILYYKNQIFDEKYKDSYSAEIYYKKSLCTILSYWEEESDINERCKAFCNKALTIKESLEKFQDVNCQTNTPRDNYIYHIALSLEDLGYVEIARYEKPYTYNHDFLNALSKAIMYSKPIIEALPHNNIERAILYYWSASRLYNMSCERGLSTKCYRETAYALLVYIRNMDEKECATIQLKEIFEFIRNIGEHLLISQYRQYEHINLSEFDTLQWVKGLEMFQMIDLGDLSISPDVEELIYIYYTLQLYLYRIIPNGVRSELVTGLSLFYHSNVMTGKHPCSTLASTVQNLKLKSKFNEQMLVSLFRCSKPMELETLQFIDLANYVYGDISDPLVKAIFPETVYIKGKPDELDIKLDLLEFLITDGMFCLSRVLELVIPLRNTTLFNNSFKADIYLHLFRFNYLYKLLYCYYYYGTDKDDDRQIALFLEWQEDAGGYFMETVQNNDFYKIHIKALRPIGSFENRRINLFKDVMKVTRKSNPTNTHLSFLAENAIHYYTKARQLHFQGKSYQETIRNLFFLDDDLNNDTLQFYMALERFDISAGVLHEIESRLKERFRKNRSYQIDKYFSRMAL